jgi:hypothetical protein
MVKTFLDAQSEKTGRFDFQPAMDNTISSYSQPDSGKRNERTPIAVMNHSVLHKSRKANYSDKKQRENQFRGGEGADEN